MQYRQFGSLDWQVSALGFGTMRLPVLDGDSRRIDEEAATRMLRHAIDQGVNYVDTAYPYHGGQAEIFLARALADGYRRRVRVATKLPPWSVKDEGDLDCILDEQRERLTANLEEALKQRVHLTEQIDEGLLGGARIETDGRVIDGSLRARLEGLRARLET